MRILVTGGAGYIGSVTTSTLLARGHDVVVLDDLRTGHRAAVPDGATFVHADVADRPVVEATLVAHDADAIVHFAASSLVGESMRDPMAYFGNNTAGSIRLLEAAQATGVRRFVFSSTAALYGTPDAVPIPETAPVRPESVYGASKHGVEQVLDWASRTAGLGAVALRYFNAAGATEARGEDHRPETHLVPIVLEAAAGRRDGVRIYGDDYPTPDGTAVRDYVHVADLAEAHALAVEAAEPGRFEAYNLGSGVGYSVREVIDTVRDVTGADVPAEVGPRRAGDPPRLVASVAKIGAALGWTPHRSDLRGIVASAWAWHRAHPDGYAERS
ncbi:MAG: UDP-glucose 4-epimerase GalE [Trueperaceae bacterium]|nr:UDP-glucose 4-epimerase GalE [Trueperaceae bacterium]